MPRMLIFGMGYTASRLADHLRRESWDVTGTRREASDNAIAFDNEPAILQALSQATHILSSVPPAKDGSEPVLDRYGKTIANADLKWVGYLSSTGVYGDTQGAWVDETALIGSGRRKARSKADHRWQKLHDDVRVFRLPGIYGPERNPLERVKTGRAKRVNMPGQIFSRIHVDDIVSAITASFKSPSGVYNIADDHPEAQQRVIAYAAQLSGIKPPPLLSIEEAELSTAAKAFYDENRRIATGKANRLLGWQPQFRDYKAGLSAILKD